MTQESSNKPLFEVDSLTIGINGSDQIIVDDINFKISSGEILALVGESGSGKSVTAAACCGLYPEPRGYKVSGRCFFQGLEISEYSEKDWMKFRGKEVAMIFQEPGAALNPLMTIKTQMLECFKAHRDLGTSTNSLLSKCHKMLERVGLESERVLKSYPHELSGGMQQRVMIAMGLLLSPKLLIADEPTTALDVTVQAQIMNLLLELQAEFNLSILFITHNLALVAQYCDRLVVMQNGLIVEESDVVSFIKQPKSIYGQKLLNAVPRL